MGKPIHIHAGAHRTGTSSFQLCLAENRARLAERGIDAAYPRRDGAPGGRLRLRLPAPRHGEGQQEKFVTLVREAVAAASPDPARALVLSEENIPGRMFHFYEGRFFPASAARLRALRAGLGTRPAHLLYVVRPYDALFVSAWRKRAEENPVRPFPEIVPRLLAMDRGWPELVAEMRDLLQPDRLTVIPYEARGQSRALLARLVPGLAVDDLAEPARALNLSATDAAIAALQARYHAGERLGRAEWRRVVEDHAGDRDSQGLAEFSPADAATLRARYDRDLARLAALDGVRFG